MKTVKTFFAVDPGETTGFCLAALPEAATVKAMFDQRIRFEVNQRGRKGEIEHESNNRVAEAVGDEYIEFVNWCARRDYGKPELIIEDFILRTQSRDKEALSPIRLTGLIIGYIMGSTGKAPKVIYQQPSHAKSFVTDTRLKNWNVWIPGKVHGRDAIRHAALRAANRLRE